MKSVMGAFYAPYGNGLGIRARLFAKLLRVLSLILGVKIKTVLGSFPSELDAIHAAKILKEKNHG